MHDRPVEDGGQHPPQPVVVRRLGALGMMVICLGICASGPTAVETSLTAGGGLLTIIAYILVPLFISLPQIFVVAELSALMPTQAGAVVWVTRGLGPRIGFVYGWTTAFTALSDVTLPALLCEQLVFRSFGTESDHHVWWMGAIVRTSIVVATVVIALSTLNRVSKLALPATMCALVVVAVGFFAAWDKVTWNAIAVRSKPDHINLGTLAASAMWQYNGWITAGATSGEALDTHSYVSGCVGALVVSALQYILAALVMVAMALGPAAFTHDMFVIVAFQEALYGLGPILNVLLILLTLTSATVALSLNSRQAWGLTRLGWMPARLGTVTEDGTPLVLTLLIAAVVVPLLFMDFAVAVVVFSSLAALNQALVPIAQWRLRTLMPDAARSFRVPGGEATNFFLVLSQVTGVLTVLLVNVAQNPELALCALIVFSTVAIVAFLATPLFAPFLDAGEDDVSTSLLQPMAAKMPRKAAPSGFPADRVTQVLLSRGFL